MPHRHQAARAIGGDDAGRLRRQQARQDYQRRWCEMPRHRRCQLPQRIGEDVRQHQIERGAQLRIAARRSRWRGSPAPDAPTTLSRAFSRATRTEGGSMSLASTCSCSAFAAAIASTPVPVPRSSTRRGRQRLQDVVEQQQAAARGAVMAGAERERRLDLDAELVGRARARGHARRARRSARPGPGRGLRGSP